MITQRQLFLNHVAQTSDFPLGLSFEKAEGIYLYNQNGDQFVDLIAGISVSNLGHRHPKVIAAVQLQLEKYTYLMVYGEYIQSPQVELAELMAKVLPGDLSSVFFVNSGSEANEGALKLAKRYTGRREIIAFDKAYHGSTHGCLSVIGGEEYRSSFEPLLPETKQLSYNNFQQLSEISKKTAAVLVEPIQGEAGVVLPEEGYLCALRERCTEVGAMLIYDEVQTGFGRTGKMFAMQHDRVTPDIVTFAKGMGGGFPIGAFVSSKEIMGSLKTNPILGHISTFGGHPVSCTAAHANLKVLVDQPEIVAEVEEKGAYFESLIDRSSSLILDIRRKGLLMAIEFPSFEMNEKIIHKCIENKLITDWFLFNDRSLRIAPPLIITKEELKRAAEKINKAIASYSKLERRVS